MENLTAGDIERISKELGIELHGHIPPSGDFSEQLGRQRGFLDLLKASREKRIWWLNLSVKERQAVLKILGITGVAGGIGYKKKRK